MYTIQLIEKEKINTILPLVQQLNPNTAHATLEERLSQMLAQGYQCVGVYDKEQLIGISGIWIITKFYVPKYIEPDNVFILPKYQGKGIGKMLMDWIFEYAKKQGCEASELNCYVDNEQGKQFWEHQGYIGIGIHYQKKL